MLNTKFGVAAIIGLATMFLRRTHTYMTGKKGSKMINRKKNCVIMKFGRIAKGNVMNNLRKIPPMGGRGGHLEKAFSSLFLFLFYFFFLKYFLKKLRKLEDKTQLPN